VITSGTLDTISRHPSVPRHPSWEPLIYILVYLVQFSSNATRFLKRKCRIHSFVGKSFDKNEEEMRIFEENWDICEEFQIDLRSYSNNYWHSWVEWEVLDGVTKFCKGSEGLSQSVFILFFRTLIFHSPLQKVSDIIWMPLIQIAVNWNLWIKKYVTLLDGGESTGQCHQMLQRDGVR